MGKHPRVRQVRLPEKLLTIRKALGLSQNQLLRHLDLENLLDRASISNYELGDLEPQLYVILKYARAAGISTDILIDDDLDLPAKLSGLSKPQDIAFKKSGSKSKSPK